MKKLMLAAAAVATFATAGGAAAQSFNVNSSYADPDQTTTAQYRIAPRAVCADPWVTIALVRVYGSANSAYCAPALYNNGQWSNFDQLVKAVAATKNSFSASGVTLASGLQNGAPVIGILVGGQLVAAGGGNLVAAGGGNLLGQAAPLQVPATTPPANLVAAGGGNYTLQSGRSVKLPAGNGLRW